MQVIRFSVILTTSASTEETSFVLTSLVNNLRLENTETLLGQAWKYLHALWKLWVKNQYENTDDCLYH